MFHVQVPATIAVNSSPWVFLAGMLQSCVVAKKEHTARPRQYLSGQMDKQEIGLSDVFFSTKVNSANVSPIPKLCPFLTLFHICIFVLFACAPRHLSKQVMKENGLRMSD